MRHVIALLRSPWDYVSNHAATMEEIHTVTDEYQEVVTADMERARFKLIDNEHVFRQIYVTAAGGAPSELCDAGVITDRLRHVMETSGEGFYWDRKIEYDAREAAVEAEKAAEVAAAMDEAKFKIMDVDPKTTLAELMDHEGRGEAMETSEECVMASATETSTETSAAVLSESEVAAKREEFLEIVRARFKDRPGTIKAVEEVFDDPSDVSATIDKCVNLLVSEGLTEGRYPKVLEEGGWLLREGDGKGEEEYAAKVVSDLEVYLDFLTLELKEQLKSSGKTCAGRDDEEANRIFAEVLGVGEVCIEDSAKSTTERTTGKRVLNRGNVLKQIWLNNGKVEDSLKKTFLIDESDSAKLAKFSEILRQLCVSKPNNKWELKVTGKRYEEFETYVKNLIEDEKKELPNPPKNEPPNGVQRKKFRGKARSPDPDPAPPSLSTSLPDPFAAQEALLAKLNELIPPAYRVTVAEVKDRRRELRHDYEGSTLRPTVMYFDGVPMVETDPAWLGNDDYCSNDVLEVNVNSPIMHVQYDVNESVYFYNEEGGVVHWCNEKEKWIEVESVEDVKKSRRKHVLTLASPDDYSVKEYIGWMMKDVSPMLHSTFVPEAEEGEKPSVEWIVVDWNFEAQRLSKPFNTYEERLLACEGIKSESLKECQMQRALYSWWLDREACKKPIFVEGQDWHCESADKSIREDMRASIAVVCDINEKAKAVEGYSDKVVDFAEHKCYSAMPSRREYEILTADHKRLREKLRVDVLLLNELEHSEEMNGKDWRVTEGDKTLKFAPDSFEGGKGGSKRGSEGGGKGSNPMWKLFSLFQSITFMIMVDIMIDELMGAELTDLEADDAASVGIESYFHFKTFARLELARLRAIRAGDEQLARSIKQKQGRMIKGEGGQQLQQQHPQGNSLAPVTAPHYETSDEVWKD